jgi:hypothetical protein
VSVWQSVAYADRKLESLSQVALAQLHDPIIHEQTIEATRLSDHVAPSSSPTDGTERRAVDRHRCQIASKLHNLLRRPEVLDHRIWREQGGNSVSSG